MLSDNLQVAMNVPDVGALGGPGPPAPSLHGADLCPRSPAGVRMDLVVLAADLPTTPHAENSLQPWVGAGHRSWVSRIPGGLPGPQPKASEHPPGLPIGLLPRVPTLGIPTSQNATGQGMGAGGTCMGLQAVCGHAPHHCAHSSEAPPPGWLRQIGPVVGLWAQPTCDHSESSARVEPEAAACPKGLCRDSAPAPCASIPSSLTALGGSTGQQPAQTDGYRGGPAPASISLEWDGIASPPCTPSPSVLTEDGPSTSLPLPSPSALLSLPTCHPHPTVSSPPWAPAEPQGLCGPGCPEPLTPSAGSARSPCW